MLCLRIIFGDDAAAAATGRHMLQERAEEIEKAGKKKKLDQRVWRASGHSHLLPISRYSQDIAKEFLNGTS